MSSPKKGAASAESAPQPGAAQTESTPLLGSQQGAAGPSRIPAGPTRVAFPTYNDPFSPEALAQADHRARRRLVHAILAGFAIWIFVGIVFGIGSFGEWGEPRWSRPDWAGRPEPPVRDGKVISCGGFDLTAPSVFPGLLDDDDEERMSATAIYHLNVEQAGGLYVSANGALSTGQLEFKVERAQHKEAQKTGGRGDHRVEVEVRASYDSPSLLEYVNICILERKSADGSHATGLGIYSPEPDSSYSRHIRLHLTMRVPPELHTLSTLEVHALELSVNGSLPTPLIRLADFKAASAAIEISEMHARALRVQTTNGPVDFTKLNVSRSLGISTSNGHIAAKINLFRPSENDDALPPPGEPREADADLSSSVHATTVNGPIALDFIGHPADQILNLYASTTNGRANVALASGYEGDLEVQTTWGEAKLERGPSFNATRDPLGKGRRHSLEIRTDTHGLGYSRITGTTWWSAKGKPADRPSLGDVKIRTTIGAASMLLK